MDLPNESESTRAPKDFIVFGAPLIEDAEINEIVDSVRSGWLGTGPKVQRFEEQFADYKDSERAVAVNSCTAALHLAMLVAGVGPGDEVITTPLTFCATINSILHAGATPILADVDPATMNIDPQAVERVISPRTRAIIPVHFAGRPCEMDALTAIAAKHDLKLIEDCAHAIETEFKGRKAGTFGDFGCFSFYATKNVTCGEGGMVLTKREEDAERIKTLALHGMTKDAWHRFGDEGYKHYLVVECGFKYNMMDLQAAIGLHQMARVEKSWLRRQELWSRYNQEFADLAVTLPQDPAPNTRHGLHLYTLLVDEERTGITRDEFLDGMTREGIGVGVHYIAATEHPYYQDRFGWNAELAPHATRIGRQTISLPLSPKVSDQDASRVIAAVRKLLG
ncbi:MAG: dTDP-4-amino-4,6-dideoxygalactose transaminase [Planctomycetota bacterium]|jgi:dTDP-4-amino-4,6-dideoxygalactose transaminase